MHNSLRESPLGTTGAGSAGVRRRRGRAMVDRVFGCSETTAAGHMYVKACTAVYTPATLEPSYGNGTTIPIARVSVNG